MFILLRWLLLLGFVGECFLSSKKNGNSFPTEQKLISFPNEMMDPFPLPERGEVLFQSQLNNQQIQTLGLGGVEIGCMENACINEKETEACFAALHEN